MKMPRRKHASFDNVERPMAVMENVWLAGSSTGMHSHPRAQLLYAIAGVMTIQSDAGTWVIPPTRALWITAGVRHEVTMSGEVHMRTAYIDASSFDALPSQSCAINVSPLLRELLVAAVALPVDYPLGDRAERLLTLLIDEIRISPAIPLHLPLPQDSRIRRICDVLMKQPSEVATAAQWGDAIGIGAKTIHRLFIKETGMTFAQWREQARLLTALRKIAQGERVIDVAFECGYSSQSAFTAMFKRRFGATPSAFYR